MASFYLEFSALVPSAALLDIVYIVLFLLAQIYVLLHYHVLVFNFLLLQASNSFM